MPNGFSQKYSAPVWIACLVYIVIHATIHLYWANARPSPPEPDDAYTYILKASQVTDGCGLQDCAAINDLRSQLSEPAADPTAERHRYRLLLQTMLVYHPLYTAVMLGLGQLGLTWEQAYTAISILGVVLIGAGLGYLLSGLWGPTAAAVAVLLIAVTSFRGQGLLYIVPSNLAFGAALFLWGAAIRGHRGWLLAVLSAAALLLHPIGKLYCVAAIPMMLLMERKLIPGWRTILSCAAILALVGLSVLVPMLIERPMLRAVPPPWPADATWLGGVFQNVVRALQTIFSFDGRGQPFSTLVGLGIYFLAWRGFSRLNGDQKWRVLAAFIPLSGIGVLSLGHILLHYPGEAFIRVWIALAAILAAGAGYALLAPGGLLYAPDTERLPGRLAFLKVRTASLAFLVVVAASGAVPLINKVLFVRDRHFETYVPAQVHRAVADCGTLLFAGETAALFYLSHGAHRCAVRYLPARALSERASLADGLRDAPRPLLLVAPQPGPRELRLDRSHPVRVEVPQAAAGQIQVKVRSHGDAVLLVRSDEGTELGRIEVPGASSPQWIALSDSLSSVPDTLQITVSGARGPVYIEGLRTSESQTTDWPWGDQVTLHYARGYSFTFSAAGLGGGLFEHLEPIDTQGSTMLGFVR